MIFQWSYDNKSTPALKKRISKCVPYFLSLQNRNAEIIHLSDWSQEGKS